MKSMERWGAVPWPNCTPMEMPTPNSTAGAWATPNLANAHRALFRGFSEVAEPGQIILDLLDILALRALAQSNLGLHGRALGSLRGARLCHFPSPEFVPRNGSR
jgi:hypothetical protein